MKFTLTCEENPQYKWKTSTEFESHQLNDIISNMDSFLRGCGFNYDGNLDITFYEDEKEQNRQDEIKINCGNSVFEDILSGLSSWQEDTILIQEKVCSLCNLPVNINQRHGCNELACPVNK